MGGLWGALGAIWSQESFKSRKSRFGDRSRTPLFGPLLGSIFGPEASKIDFLAVFLMPYFENQFFIDFW